MLIKMLETTPGSEDGIRVREYAAGLEYNMAERLATIFCDVMKVADRVVISPIETFVKEEPKPEQKMVEDSPLNKAVSTTPSNKRGRRR